MFFDNLFLDGRCLSILTLNSLVCSDIKFFKKLLRIKKTSWLKFFRHVVISKYFDSVLLLLNSVTTLLYPKTWHKICLGCQKAVRINHANQILNTYWRWYFSYVPLMYGSGPWNHHPWYITYWDVTCSMWQL